MTDLNDRISSILVALQRAREDMLAVTDDLWLGIDHTDNASIDQGVALLKAYNECLSEFTDWLNRYRRMVENPTLGAVLTLPSLAPEAPIFSSSLPVPPHDLGQPYSLHEDFRYTKPSFVELAGFYSEPVKTWRDVYCLTCRHFARSQPDFLARVTEYSKLQERSGSKPLFSENPDVLRDPLPITERIFAEGNLSANGIKYAIEHILDIFGIPRNTFKVFLRQPSEG